MPDHKHSTQPSAQALLKVIRSILLIQLPIPSINICGVDLGHTPSQRLSNLTLHAPCGGRFSRSGVKPNNLHFYQVSR